MRGERDPIGAPARDRADDVRHLDDARRRHGIEWLLAKRDAAGLQLRLDVLAAGGERRRAGGTWTEGHLFLEMRPRAVAVEGGPAGRRRRGRGAILRVGAAGDEDERRRRNEHLL